MSPFPRLHHHDIMTVVGSACSGRTAPYNTSCNIGALKTVSRQHAVDVPLLTIRRVTLVR